MIIGQFGDTSGRPYMTCSIYFPRLQVAGEIALLVDTGADKSLIMPADRRRLNIPHDMLSGHVESAGIVPRGWRAGAFAPQAERPADGDTKPQAERSAETRSAGPGQTA